MFQAYLESKNTIRLMSPGPLNHKFKLLNLSNGAHIRLSVINEKNTQIGTEYLLGIMGFFNFASSFLVVTEEGSVKLEIGKVTQTPWFDNQFFAPNVKLGFTYTTNATTFRVWAPTAMEVEVLLYRENVEHYPMTLTLGGVWETELSGDLDGALYRYLVVHHNEKKEAIDPYGIASNANAEYSAVINLEKTPRVSQLTPSLKKPTDAIIYEVNVRDFTIHESSSTEHKGQYLGLTEIKHLKELGVTHIQLLPIYDFEGIDELNPEESYNWGYNPIQFNVPEGSYSSNPNDPYARIIELKTLINTLHEQGLYVVMDVVYNHVCESIVHPFNTIVPGYYYRYDEQGKHIEGSGCGNDLASERKMVRKYIIDSVKYWLEEYGVDGFRFDLMGLLDVVTMNEVRKICDSIDKNILLYGEGWHIPTGIASDNQASMNNADEMPRISHFNDFFRDNIKGSTWHKKDKGLAFGNLNFIDKGLINLRGEHQFFFDPVQSVNYVECHDNYTLWDKSLESNPELCDEERKQRHLLATSMTIFAQGIPFIHGGQEFFRTKYGVENSYKSMDKINAIQWNQSVLHEHSVKMISGYLSIRKSHDAFRFMTASEVNQYLTVTQIGKSIIEYKLTGVEKFGLYETIIIYFNLGMDSYDLWENFDGYNLIANENQASLEIIKELNYGLTLAPLSTYVLVK